jgi:tetratricopeptide (TPR) repeat protein
MRKYQKIILTAILTGGGYLAQAQHTQIFTSPERFYQEGLELYDRQKFGAAQEAFERYMMAVDDPLKAANAQYYHAVSGLFLHHPDAEKLVLQFAAAHPTHPKAPLAYYELGSYFFQNKDYNKTISYLEKANPSDLNASQKKEADFKLAYAYFANKKFDKAKALFDRNKAGDHKYVYASNYYSGYIAYRNGDYTGAKVDLRIAEQNEAYRQIVPYMLTEILYKQGERNEVISYGEKILNSTPKPQNADEIQLLVGDSYYQKNDYKTASKYFTEYSAGKKKIDNLVQYKIGFAAFKNGEYPTAIDNLKEIALKKDSLGQHAAYHLGLSYLKEKDKPSAQIAFDQARRTRFSPEVAEAATLKYAQLHYENGNFREVITALADFSKDYPGSALSHEADDILSEAYLNSNNYLDAIKHIEGLRNKSKKILQTYQRVTYYQAVNYFNEGKLPQAQEMIVKSLEFPLVDEVTAATHLLKGETLSAAGQYDQAINSYATVFRTPGASRSDAQLKARYGIGYAYFNTKQYDKAMPHFKAYLTDNSIKPGHPNYGDAIVRLADTYYVNKEYNQALTTYDRAISSNVPDRDYAMLQKGAILWLTNRREEAMQTLQNLITSHPDSRYADAAAYQKAIIDFESGNYGPAVAGFTNLINNRAESRLVPFALQRRGIAYNNLRRHQEAAADFKRVLDEFPTSRAASNSLLSLQESLNATNQAEEFDQYLTHFKNANPQSDALESIEFEAAKSLYFSENYPQAATKFEAYLQNYPNNNLAVEARYFLADAYFRQNKKEIALQRMREVVAENKSEYVNRAVARVAEMEFENQNYHEAIKFYNRLREQSNNRRDQASALLGIMKSHYLLKDYDNTRKAATALIDLGGATPLALNTAMLYRGKAFYDQGKLDEAIKEFTATATAATDVSGAEAQYLLAEALFKQKKYAESVDAAQKSAISFADHEYWLGRSFILIAENFAAQNEMFQAKQTLTSVIENSPLPEIVDLAKAKLAGLEVPTQPAQPEETNRKTRTNRNTAQKDSIR